MDKELKYTLSSTFIFPLLDIDKGLFSCKTSGFFGNLVLNDRFINAYLDNETFPHFQHYKVHLLMTGFRDKEFDGFSDTLDSKSNFEDEYEYKLKAKRVLGKDPKYIVKIFTIPDKFKNDYDLILDGKYSRVSKDARTRIINHAFGKKSLLLTLPKIFNRDEEVRLAWEKKLSFKGSNVSLEDREVWTKIKIANETLTDDIINNLSAIAEQTKKINPMESL